MIRQRTATTSIAGLISILIIYFSLIVLILVFARQIISDVSLESPISYYVVIPVAVFLPLLLAVVIGLNVYRIWREKRRGHPGVTLKIRLMLFFTIITLLSSIPQGILSVSFIEIAMSRWFSSPIAEGLDGGVDLVLQYNLEKVKGLRTFGGSPLLTGLYRDIPRSPENVWDGISKTSNLADSLQIYLRGGEEYAFFGDERGKVSYQRVSTWESGLANRESYEEFSALRYLRRQTIGDTEYLIILSTIIPKDFDKKAERLTASNDTFNQIDLFQPVFRITLILFYLFFSFPLILLSLLISFLLSEEVIQPIVSLEDATRRVADGDFSYRILNRADNELSSLVTSFNRMVSELESSRHKLLQTEKISAWQEIAQRMAHEIRNPLTPIKLSAQRILYRYLDKNENFDTILKQAVSTIIHEVENLNNLLGEFRDFARLPAPQITDTPLKSIIEEITVAYRESHSHVSFDLEDLDSELTIPADESQMRQVFTNLIKNACEAIENEGTVMLRTDLVRKRDKQYCRIQVKDTGSGILKDFHGQVFNPYFTTKDGGTGLGLPIVERIIFDHSGQIWFETEKNTGTTFFIDLPLER